AALRACDSGAVLAARRAGRAPPIRAVGWARSSAGSSPGRPRADRGKGRAQPPVLPWAVPEP
ncbi:hypothetical protein Nmel_000189, partial [Mimus melanotis]